MKNRNVTPRMKKKRQDAEMAAALAKALERERLFEDQGRRMEWLRSVRDEMSLEEVFTLCTSPSIFQAHEDWQQERLRSAWVSKAEERKLEAVRAFRPWPTGRMFDGGGFGHPDQCFFPDTPLRRGITLFRRRYETLLSLREAGLFEDPSLALATLLGPPNRDYTLSDRGHWWSHVRPDEIWSETFVFSNTVSHLMPKALKDAMLLSRWEEDHRMREGVIPLDVGKFPSLQALGLRLKLVLALKSGSGRYGVDLQVDGPLERDSSVFHLCDGVRTGSNQGFPS